MDGPVLSARERQILAVIEAELRTDTELDRRLRSMRLGRVRHAVQMLCRVPVNVLVLLAACSFGLLSVGVRVHSYPALGAFALVCAATVVLLVARGARRLGTWRSGDRRRATWDR
ncbi:DUF3040 domain-containing protein [Kitasatospora sp. NPDC056138]|uniref:DUF3040 domain-containing protein n=1 Tax=Kitasatospora sp. NPDC056138 TaxID=3345724 RepID=UPI0035E149D0